MADRQTQKNLTTSCSTEVLSAARVEQLREQEGATVLEYKVDPEAVLPMAEVSQRINEARRLFHEHRRIHPSFSDEQIRDAIRKQVGRFAETHRRIFECVVSRTTTQEVFKLLEQGIATQLLVEKGELEADVAMAAMNSEVLKLKAKREGRQ